MEVPLQFKGEELTEVDILQLATRNLELPITMGPEERIVGYLYKIKDSGGGFVDLHAKCDSSKLCVHITRVKAFSGGRYTKGHINLKAYIGV